MLCTAAPTTTVGEELDVQRSEKLRGGNCSSDDPLKRDRDHDQAGHHQEQ
jgi:hypothetical protein